MQSSGFRPGEDLAAHERPAFEPPAPALGFTAAADAGGTDLDVLMGYQILLGRDPENSFVIADAKSSPVGAFIRALVSSGEFQSSVLDRLDSGRPLPHEAAAIAPTRHQLDWLFRIITTPSYAETMLRSAPTWRDFLRVFLAIPGVPLPPARAAAAKPAEPSIAAVAADEGFVLINLEQPKPGEKLHPGVLVSGSGWTIAPGEIAEIAILLDDHLLTHARYGLPRPDVARVFPHYRHVDHCGFAFTAEIPAAALTPASQLVVRVRTTTGEEGTKGLRVQPPAPSGASDSAAAADAWPIRLSVDEALVDDSRVLRVRGWAATRASLHVITAQLGKTPLDGVRFGLARPDIAKAHPDYPNAATSGFALNHDLADDVPAGPAFVRLQATDSAGHSRQTILPVTIPTSRRTPASAASLTPRDAPETIAQPGAPAPDAAAVCSSTLPNWRAIRRAKFCAAHSPSLAGSSRAPASMVWIFSAMANCSAAPISACAGRISVPPSAIFPTRSSPATPWYCRRVRCRPAATPSSCAPPPNSRAGGYPPPPKFASSLRSPPRTRGHQAPTCARACPPPKPRSVSRCSPAPASARTFTVSSPPAPIHGRL
jgi:hypothetical protein